MSIAIETTPLKKVYSTGSTGGLPANLDDGAISFPALRIPRGGLVAIRGVSGVGKSTLLNLLAGLDRPDPIDPGDPCRILLRFAPDGPTECVDIAAADAAIPRHRIGFMFQQGHLLSNLSVALNIALPGLVHARPMAALGRRPIDNAGIDRFMTELRLSPAEHKAKRAWQLSGGQAQRVAFARAIAHDPDIVFADEPTSSLDDENAYALICWLKRWLAEDPSRTVVWVTHDRALADEMADWLLDLERFFAEEIRNNTLAPVRNDRVRPLAELMARYRAGDAPAGTAAGAAEATGPRRRRPPIREAGFAMLLATSELCSRRKAMARTRQQKALSARLAHVPGSAGRRPTLLRALPGMARAYADWRTTLTLLLSSLLLFAAIAGGLTNWRLASEALADPLSCRLELLWREGLAQRPFPRSAVAKLAERPWSGLDEAAKELAPPKDFEFVPATCRTGPSAFGSIIEPSWGLGAVIGGKCQPERIDSRILVTPRNDPMFRKVAMYRTNAAGGLDRGRTMYENLFDRDVLPGNDLYLTLDRYEALRDRLSKRLGAQVEIKQLCLTEGDDSASEAGRLIFDLAGIIDDLPTIGIRRANVFMPDEVHQRWITAMRGDLRPFEKALLYFDPWDYARVDAHLQSQGEGRFHYSADDLKRIKARVLVYVATLFAIGFLCVMLASIFGSYLYNGLLHYMEVNAKPLSVLIAFGVRPAILRSMVIWRAIVNLLVGIVSAAAIAAAIIGLANGISWAVERMHLGTQAFAWLPLDADGLSAVTSALRGDDLLMSVGLTLCIVILIVWALARRTVNGWSRRNRYVAANLA